ncbi:MAG: tetratricopeptide repeat protein, partial [Ignavibacteriae bacterium]|nr:tetratricopeptide repeat protein [Ignavibacteriota bacterium]
QMLLRIGRLEAQSGASAQAIATFGSIARDFPDGSAAEEALFGMMQEYYKLGQGDSAMSAGSRYLRIHPVGKHTATVLARLAEASLQHGNAQSAAELYQKLADDFEYSSMASNARNRLAEAYLASNNYGNALSILTDLYEQQSLDPLTEEGVESSLYLALAKAHHAAGNGTEAKRNLFKFLARKPSGEQAGEAYNLLGMIYRSEGSLELATSYFRQAGLVAPATAASREVADLLFSNGSYVDAVNQYIQLAQSAKSEMESQYFDAQIILSRLRNDELSAAEKLISQFEKRYKNNDEDMAAFELERGNYHFRRRDYTTARKLFDRVESKYDNTASAPAAMYWIGKILEATGKPQEAIKQFEGMMKDYPNAPIVQRAHFALGNIYHSAEKWDESIQNYRRVVDNPNPDAALLPYALSNLIETYEAAGIFDAALSATRKYLDLYPNNEDSFDKKIKIGIQYTRLGYNDQAIEHLQGLLDQAGPDLEGELRYYIAEANFSKGDYQQAILDFLKVPYLVTKKGTIDWTANSLYMSGRSYEKMGRYDQALTMYQQIVDRSGIDETFKTAARKEIDRVKMVLKKNSN